MADSSYYHVGQQQQIDPLRQSPIDSTVAVKPLHVADVIVTSKYLSNEAHHMKGHQSTISPISYPRPIYSRSDFSYTQPASLVNEESRHVPLTSTKNPVTVQEHRDLRNSREAGYAVHSTRVRDQVPSHRFSQARPAEHTTYTYTCDESLDERVESGDHALWILVSWPARNSTIMEHVLMRTNRSGCHAFAHCSPSSSASMPLVPSSLSQYLPLSIFALAAAPTASESFVYSHLRSMPRSSLSSPRRMSGATMLRCWSLSTFYRLLSVWALPWQLGWQLVSGSTLPSSATQMVCVAKMTAGPRWWAFDHGGRGG